MVVVAVVVCRIRSSQVVVWVCVIVSYRVIHGHPIGNLKNASRSSGNHGKLRFCHVRSRALIQTKRHLEAWDAYTIADHAFRIAAITPNDDDGSRLRMYTLERLAISVRTCASSPE